MEPIALIAPYDSMESAAKQICADFNLQITVIKGDLQEGLKKGQTLVEKGTEVIISRGGTAQLLKKHLTIPVVEIKVTGYDVLHAIKKIPQNCNKIGIIGFNNIIYGAEKLSYLLGMDLNVINILKEEDAHNKLKEAKDNNLDLIIGDQIIVHMAKQLGFNTVLIESGRESILQSIQEASEILEAVRSEADKSKQHLNTLNQLKAVIDTAEDQLIILDSDDKIQLCNATAINFFKKSKEQLIGSNLNQYPTEPLKYLKKTKKIIRNHLAEIDKNHVLLDYIPISTNGVITGTLIVGRDISRLQHAERIVRNELHHKGHLARYSFNDIIGDDIQFQKAIKISKVFAKSKATILIIGETGTGKEMFAQGIHNECFGSDRPFVAINCATVPENLLESELFGYAPGAFTGAKKQRKKGFFELAHGGSLFLDEIGELPLNLQSRLLRVIEERQIQPIGDDRVIPIDIRIIAATNKDLFKEVREKRFRPDLYYRLNTLQLTIPPLRERGADALVLFKHFVEKTNPDFPKNQIINQKIKNLFAEYDWQGNVRELRNLVERISILTNNFQDVTHNITNLIEEQLIVDAHNFNDETEKEEVLSLKELQKSYIKKLCDSKRLNQQDVAKLIGISRTTLWKIKKSF